MRPGSGRPYRYGAAVLLSALVIAGPSAATPAQAASGPASPTDLDFVRRVHLTLGGVSPVSALAQQVGAKAEIKKLAAQIDKQDETLERLVRSTATALKVDLTGSLPADERTSLAVLEQQTGAVFDDGYVNYLWTVDSALLPIAMTVCGSSRSTAVRQLAERADTAVAAQLPLLQKTGLLHMAVLPTPTAAAATKLPGGVPMDQSLMAQTRSDDGFLSATTRERIIVLLAALAVAATLGWRLVSRSTAAGRRRSRHRVRP